MNVDSVHSRSISTVASSTTGSERLRVALVCDYLEEQWPSMNLVGDMLGRHLESCCGDSLEVIQLRPPFRPRAARLPFISQRLTRNADRLINRFLDYPYWLNDRLDDYDIFHIVDHSYAQLVHGLPPGRAVVTCHDLDTFRSLLQPERERRPRWFRTMTLRILEGLKKAAHVVAVSSATREELLQYKILPPERITVVPNGVNPAYTVRGNPAADAAADRLFPENAKDHLWLLSVGSTAARKRLDVLLQAFARIRHELPNTMLARVGGFTSAHIALAKELNVHQAILMLPQLDSDVLAAVYRRSTLLLHTADSEGFGLPVVEAMSCGCPVLASDIPVLREVAGQAGAFCRAGEPDAWENAAVRLLRESTDEHSRWDLRRKSGLAHSARFSWAHSARLTADIYKRVWQVTSRTSLN